MMGDKPTMAEIRVRQNTYVPHSRIIDPSGADGVARECNELNDLLGILLDRLEKTGEQLANTHEWAVKVTLDTACKEHSNYIKSISFAEFHDWVHNMPCPFCSRTGLQAANELADDLIRRSNVPIRGKKQAKGYVWGLRRAAAELGVILGDNQTKAGITKPEAADARMVALENMVELSIKQTLDAEGKLLEIAEIIDNALPLALSPRGVRRIQAILKDKTNDLPTKGTEMKTIEHIIKELRCLETDLREVVSPGDADFQADRVLHIIRDLEGMKPKDGMSTKIHGSGTGND